MHLFISSKIRHTSYWDTRMVQRYWPASTWQFWRAVRATADAITSWPFLELTIQYSQLPRALFWGHLLLYSCPVFDQRAIFYSINAFKAESWCERVQVNVISWQITRHFSGTFEGKRNMLRLCSCYTPWRMRRAFLGSIFIQKFRQLPYWDIHIYWRLRRAFLISAVS